MPVDGTAAVIHTITLFQEGTDKHTSIWIFKHSMMLHHVDWQTVTQVLCSVVPLKCWYISASWHDKTSHCKNQRSQSLVLLSYLILLDTKQPILHQNMNQTMNETFVSVQSAQPILPLQVPDLHNTSCHTHVLPSRHMPMLCHSILVKAINSLIFPLLFFSSYHEISHPKLLRYVCVQNGLV